MAETESSGGTPQAAATARKRRAPARRRTAARKAPARRKKTSRASSRKSGNGLVALVNDFATAAGKRLQDLTGRGADAARRAVSGMGASSRKTISRLTKEWEGMDSKRRAQFVAALLAALAAASAPIVRSRLKK